MTSSELRLRAFSRIDSKPNSIARSSITSGSKRIFSAPSSAEKHKSEREREREREREGERGREREGEREGERRGGQLPVDLND
jgi:hypothetical protein